MNKIIVNGIARIYVNEIFKKTKTGRQKKTIFFMEK